MKMNEISHPNFTIIEVWSSNLEEEFKKIRKIVQKYPYVAMVNFVTSIPFFILKILIKNN